MILRVIGTGSAGNCYLLESEDEALVLEAGVHLKYLKQAIDFNVSKIVGVLISHCHGDHGKYAQAYTLAGLKVYSEFNGQFQLGGFKIKPFEVVHDVKTHGFLIEHKESGRFCFVTDTHYLPFTFPKLNNIIIECNYSGDILDHNVKHGKLPAFLRKRIMNSHMSLSTVKGIMRANDLTNVNNIVLIHLSDGNSNEKRFKKEITDITGKNVSVARNGMVIDFNKEF